MTSSLDFPPELQDLVVDHLHDQKHSLATCGLVSKSWLRSSRHHLFGSVSLRDRNWEDFVQLLGSPLATFTQSINSLTISVSDYDTHTPASSSNLNRVIFLLRTFHEPAPCFPANVLREFPVLRSLRLEDCHWTGVIETTTNSLVAMFPNITELDLHLVTFLSPPHMAVMHEPTTFELLHYPKVPRNLTHLRLRLDLSANNLRFNEVALWFHRNPPIRVLELARRRRAACAVALLAAPHSTISALTLVLSINFPELLDNLDWAYLNNALETYPQFTAIRRLHFIVHCPSDMDAMEGAIRARVQEYNVRGIVEVSLLQTSRVFTYREGQV
ncbi:hypothetical protein B0H13DRAFT_2347975 [Mycena leptocephala]|nr:hypothetical protein B0H13DRAFT_2347975 [Mycena leptocephala]